MAPCPSCNLGAQYLLTVSSKTYKERYKTDKKEFTLSGLKPSTYYNFTVQPIMKNGKPVPAVAFASTKTLPPGTSTFHPHVVTYLL
ncbi:unnamed protein product [Dibothriocephalus latus]|uniref:Fibronectin type-III domain-containing protein n=1 Tax=Dibothriocephalus latus TaxID=60516 RepID=A0A3P7MHR2_DIBLA|nr:unnamed protein product [Dibothriocephalus latus]